MVVSIRSSGICSIAFILSWPATTSAQDLVAEKQSPLVELRAEYEKAIEAWEKKYSGVRTTPDAELIERYDAWPEWRFLPQIVKLGTADAKAPYAFDALKWAAVEMSNAVGAADRQYFPYDEQVFAALRKDHLSNPRIIDLFENCSRYPTPARETFLRECIERGSTRDVRGLASYYLVVFLRHKGEAAARFRTTKPDTLSPFQQHLLLHRRSPAYMSFLGSVDFDRDAR
jgi:hypothetical protein